MVYGSKSMPGNSAVLKDNIDLQESLLLIPFLLEGKRTLVCLSHKWPHLFLNLEKCLILNLSRKNYSNINLFDIYN